MVYRVLRVWGLVASRRSPLLQLALLLSFGRDRGCL